MLQPRTVKREIVLVKMHLQFTAVQLYSCFLSAKTCPQNVVAEWRLVDCRFSKSGACREKYVYQKVRAKRAVLENYFKKTRLRRRAAPAAQRRLAGDFRFQTRRGVLLRNTQYRKNSSPPPFGPFGLAPSRLPRGDVCEHEKIKVFFVLVKSKVPFRGLKISPPHGAYLEPY